MAARTISTTGEEILPENKLRKSFILQNESGSINVFIKQEDPGQTTVSETDHDHRLGPGGVLSLNSTLDGEDHIQARYTVVASSGTPLLSFFETEDIRR